MTLQELEQTMIKHDWLYGYADDYEAYSNGAQAEMRLINACNELAQQGHTDEVKRLWDKYCPREQRKWM